VERQSREKGQKGKGTMNWLDFGPIKDYFGQRSLNSDLLTTNLKWKGELP
jgi:hypothetical protein